MLELLHVESDSESESETVSKRKSRLNASLLIIGLRSQRSSSLHTENKIDASVGVNLLKLT
jgi:hypothetical protein